MAKLSGEQIKERVKGLLNEANNTLKATGCKIRVEAKGDSLYIRGILPSRSPAIAPNPSRQRLALGLKMTPAAIAKAQEVARKISFELETERFRWDDYIQDPRETLTCGEWIEKFKDEHGANLKPSSWEGSYNSYFKRLPEDEVMSAEILLSAYSQIDPKSKRARQLCRQAYLRLANLAKIEVNLNKATRSKSDISKRDIPNDSKIIETLAKIKKMEWHFAIAILATYGLRPHELSYLDFSEMPVLKVTDGKTGARRVYPIPSEWVDLFGLMEPRSLPKVKDFGQQVSRYLSFHEIDFVAYDLRHAYALRGTVQNKISLPVMARMMGHAPQIHLATYNAWIKDAHVDNEMRSLLENK